jgi:diaminopimelate epimerase
MRIPFAKYEAAGNDFIIMRAQALTLGRRRASAARLGPFARAILGRHTGVGADGLFVVSPPADSAHDLAVRIFNADGSEAEMSGNGIRCAAAWLLDGGGTNTRRFTRAGKAGAPKVQSLTFETPAGLRTIESLGERRGRRLFRVNMGEPILDPVRIPFAGHRVTAPVTNYPLRLSGGVFKVTVTSMGNPHCSMIVGGFENLDWRALGREVERHPLFPNRTNVEFVRVLSRRRIEVRFWERGVGETTSSGTGSSAAATAAALNGLTERKVSVKTAGGGLEVNWTRSGQVQLTGPARRICSGIYEVPRLDA